MPTIGLNQQPPKESLWSGRPGYTEQFPLFDRNTENILSQLLQQGSTGLQNQLNQPYQGQGLLSQILGTLGSNRPNFDAIANQEVNRFYQQTVPSLAERFTALGTGGSQRSSAFQGALGQAGAGLGESLAALKSQFGLQQQGQDQNLLQLLLGGLQSHQGSQQNALLNMLQFGAQPRYQTQYNPPTPGIKQTLLPAAGSLLGGAANLGLNALTGGGYGLANTAYNALR